jgi:hypothetical protein
LGQRVVCSPPGVEVAVGVLPGAAVRGPCPCTRPPPSPFYARTRVCPVANASVVAGAARVSLHVLWARALPEAHPSRAFTTPPPPLASCAPRAPPPPARAPVCPPRQRAKLFRLDPVEQRWRECGTGPLRLNVRQVSGASPAASPPRPRKQAAGAAKPTVVAAAAPAAPAPEAVVAGSAPSAASLATSAPASMASTATASVATAAAGASAGAAGAVATAASPAVPADAAKAAVDGTPTLPVVPAAAAETAAAAAPAAASDTAATSTTSAVSAPDAPAGAGEVAGASAVAEPPVSEPPALSAPPPPPPPSKPSATVAKGPDAPAAGSGSGSGGSGNGYGSGTGAAAVGPRSRLIMRHESHPGGQGTRLLLNVPVWAAMPITVRALRRPLVCSSPPLPSFARTYTHTRTRPCAAVVHMAFDPCEGRSLSIRQCQRSRSSLLWVTSGCGRRRVCACAFVHSCCGAARLVLGWGACECAHVWGSAAQVHPSLATALQFTVAEPDGTTVNYFVKVCVGPTPLMPPPLVPHTSPPSVHAVCRR